MSIKSEVLTNQFLTAIIFYVKIVFRHLKGIYQTRNNFY